MTDTDDVFRSIDHAIGRLQESIRRSANTDGKKRFLQWGQFVIPPQPQAQVGVYGSSCAAIVMQLKDRDDQSARDVRELLRQYVEADSEAELELAHNIKLAMVVFALAPCPGQDASATMLNCLATLLDRCSHASNLWPAYTRPQSLAAKVFSERDSEIATAMIVILLDEVLRRLPPARYRDENAKIRERIRLASEKLESAFVSRRPTLERFSTLIATAIIIAKGRTAKWSVRKAYADAVRTRDFSDRRVFFYECLSYEGRLTRDYFIVPPAVVLPMVASSLDAHALDRALAFSMMPDALAQLDGEGLFKPGQDMASSVEQGLVGLSLQAAIRGAPTFKGFGLQAARSWIYLTRANARGVPTALVGSLVALLWAITAGLVLGRAMPLQLQALPILDWIYSFASAVPEAVSQLLVFIVAGWPASRALFFRIFRWNA